MQGGWWDRKRQQSKPRDRERKWKVQEAIRTSETLRHEWQIDWQTAEFELRTFRPFQWYHQQEEIRVQKQSRSSYNASFGVERLPSDLQT